MSHIGLLSPRGLCNRRQTNDSINTTAAEARITRNLVGDTWRRELAGGTDPIALTRAELLALEQHEAHLAIACVEGWSSGNQRRAGVRVRDVVNRAGVTDPHSVYVESLRDGGAFGRGRRPATRSARGQPVRVPGQRRRPVPRPRLPGAHHRPQQPGVRNTRWVTRLTFEP